MPLLAAVQSGIGRDEFGSRPDRRECDRLLGVEIEDSVTVHFLRGQWILFGTERRTDGLKGGHGRHGGPRHRGTKFIEAPKPDGVVHPQPRPFDLTGLHHPAGDAYVVDQSVAAEPALDEAADGELVGQRGVAGRLRSALMHDLAVHPQGDRPVIQTDEQVVPLAVADVHGGGDVVATPRDVDAEESGAGHRVDLPVSFRTLGSGGDDDVESAF